MSAGSTSPPRADLTFRVGIVGHRPNRLPQDAATLDALRCALRSVLQTVKTEVANFAASDDGKSLYSGKAPVLRAVSPLAEGSDRIFATEAIDAGYDLLCPMPFAQGEYEKDFLRPKALEPNSCDRFHELLDRGQKETALTKFELDGDRAAEEKAYGAAGRVVLNQSDLLVAVWDGGKAAGGGGTVETIREAIGYHVPILWIYSVAPNSLQLLSREEDIERLDSEEPCRPTGSVFADSSELQAGIARVIGKIVRDELGLPTLPTKPGQPSTIRRDADAYLRERKPWFNVAVVWKLFRDLVGDGRIRLQRMIVEDFEIQIRDDWPTVNGNKTGVSPSMLEDWINRKLRAHYAWPDKRGDIYADAYRSAYVSIYLLSAFAVFLALLPMAAGMKEPAEIVCGRLELATLFGIVLLLVVGWLRRWHQRWMEYRLLAELIRQMKILIPLGGGRPFPRVPAHLAVYGNLDQTWMYWQMRAIARSTGLPTVAVTPAYVGDCLDCIGRIVAGQLKFHQVTEHRSGHIWHRLHIASIGLFAVTFVSIAFHLWAHALPWAGWLVLIAATLPALGAALAGIVNQGEFARLAKRSASMADLFKRFASQIAALRDGGKSQNGAGPVPARLAEVVPLAEDVALAMVDEVADWRVIVTERPVKIE